jgi:hypothetical protein
LISPPIPLNSLLSLEATCVPRAASSLAGLPLGHNPVRNGRGVAVADQKEVLRRFMDLRVFLPVGRGVWPGADGRPWSAWMPLDTHTARHTTLSRRETTPPCAASSTTQSCNLSCGAAAYRGGGDKGERRCRFFGIVGEMKGRGDAGSLALWGRRRSWPS